jgi:tetratricopeptide (TPR) repeat protein
MTEIVTALTIAPYVDDLPDLDPIIAHERTDYGWRGLTQQGEVLEVRGTNGHQIEIPNEITVARGGKPIGRRAIRNEAVDIGAYLARFNQSVALYRANHFDEALRASDAAMEAAPTIRARYNRAWVLLSAGRWSEGFAEYWECEQHQPFMRPRVRAALERGLTPWRGEDLSGKKLLLVHAHGFGDSIMMLRYVQRLWAMGANVRLDVPDVLRSLANQYAPLDVLDGECSPDYFCSLLHLLHFLNVTPESVDGIPYMAVDKATPGVKQERKRVGIAWSIGQPSDSDYPREIPLAQLVEALGDAEIHSVQVQNAERARALGVHVHELEDFADCARLMLKMDKIVSVDTAALHLAGAIGHPNVVGLLSHWSSWRWLAPWYSNVRLCRQVISGDWSSALEELSHE